MNGHMPSWRWRALAIGTLALAAFTTMTTAPLATLRGTVTGSDASSRVAPCLPGQAVPILASPHLSEAAAASARFNSEPPTSGPHFSFPAPPGIYSEPVSDGRTVHSLEHGHVVIQYGSNVPEVDVTRLEHIAKRYLDNVVLAPRPALKADIALTAWGRIDRIGRMDERRVVGFIERLRGRYDHGWARPDDCQTNE